MEERNKKKRILSVLITLVMLTGLVTVMSISASAATITYTVMLNLEIIKKDGAYDTEEGCLSLLGSPRKCKRYKTIKVQ